MAIVRSGIHEQRAVKSSVGPKFRATHFASLSGMFGRLGFRTVTDESESNTPLDPALFPYGTSRRRLKRGVDICLT